MEHVGGEQIRILQGPDGQAHVGWLLVDLSVWQGIAEIRRGPRPWRLGHSLVHVCLLLWRFIVIYFTTLSQPSMLVSQQLSVSSLWFSRFNKIYP